jgi:hypothetical protein
MTKTSQKFSMKAIRQKNAIFIDGEDEGKIIQKHIEIDDTPWFQATSLSLRNFILWWCRSPAGKPIGLPIWVFQDSSPNPWPRLSEVSF